MRSLVFEGNTWIVDEQLREKVRWAMPTLPTVYGKFYKTKTGRNPERLLNKTVIGFATHMAAKITSHTLRLLLRCQFGIDL